MAIANSNTMRMTNCTIRNNKAHKTMGEAIHFIWNAGDAQMTMDGCLVHDNGIPEGGIYFSPDETNY